MTACTRTETARDEDGASLGRRGAAAGAAARGARAADRGAASFDENVFVVVDDNVACVELCFGFLFNRNSSEKEEQLDDGS